MERKHNTMARTPNYKAIQFLSQCMDCTITQADFDTSKPNPHRISYVASDIHRYLKHVGGNLYELKH